jgi:hypothetical protein
VTPPAPKPLPSPIDCARKQLGTSPLYAYDCGLPANTVLPASSWLDDTTSLEVAVAGGVDITAFSETGIKAVAQVKPKATFDLNQIDPAAIKAEWETTTAQLVVVAIDAQLKDGAEMAFITCSEIGLIGSKTVPAGALALIPKPAATNPLIIKTSVIGFNVAGKVQAWGDYKIGAGRGTFGVSCRTPAGQCPPVP